MKLSREDFKRMVYQFVQPLFLGYFDTLTLLTAKLTGVIPFGGRSNFEIAFPYGFVSGPTSGVKAFFLNLFGSSDSPVIVAQTDLDRPSVQQGEVMLYNEFGQKIYLKNGKILLGSTAAASPAVLGDVFTTQQLALLDLLLNHKHVCSAPGAFTAALDPTTISGISNMKASPLNDGSIVSSEIFVEKG